MTRRWVGAVLVLALPGGVLADDDDFRHGRIRHVEYGVTIQRAAEPGSEEAHTNVPFLPGDRIWTDDRGRVEFQFESGAFLRLDNATKLDYLDNAGDRVVLRLWSGGLYIHEVGRGDTDFEVETPGGVVMTRGRGVYRIDARDGETRVSVYEGEANLQAGRGVRLGEGERVYASNGEVTRGPMAFDREDADDFALWADDRQETARYARQRPSDLSEDVAPFYDELYDHGSWYREPSIGYVWRPRVAIGWQPYMNGRWMWTAYGWTWIPHEPWGWAPFHYGRWGYASNGWYWIPQRRWGPAWVSWAVGGPYVGWCPLGFGNRPIIVYDRYHRGGHAIPRAGSGSWIYARQGDMTARDLARRRVEMDPASLAQVRVVGSPRARLTRDLRVAEAPPARTAVPRTARTKPTPGDTVPELRGDNQTTIPFPVVRRRRDPEERHDRGNSFGAAAGRGAEEAPAAVSAPRAPRARGADAETGSRPAARPSSGSDDGGRVRTRRPETAVAPEPRAPRTEAAPRERSRPRGEDAGGARQQYQAAPRVERSRDGGGEARTAPASDRGAARSRPERAPRTEAAPAPAARGGDSNSSSGHARRKN